MSSKNFNLLIDTSDIRQQFLSNKVKSLDCIFYTHQHTDQTHGINDLRYFLKIKIKFLYTQIKVRVIICLIHSNIVSKKQVNFILQ